MIVVVLKMGSLLMEYRSIKNPDKTAMAAICFS